MMLLFLKARPTEAQAEAGNYKMKRRRFRGLSISVENPAGSVREGVDRTGRAWRVKMPCDYGYIRRTEGVDGDQVDCFIGPDEDAPNVYVVHTRKAGAWDRYDEDKCMLGFRTRADAVRAFRAAYSDPRFLGPITTLPFDEFKAKALATLEKPKMIKAVLFRKARDPADRHTLDMFGAGTHIEARTRKDGVVQGYHVGAAAPASAVQPAAAAPPKPSARAVAALRILEAGGRFSEALERGYGGREQLAMRLLDARGRPVKGFGYKTYQELRDARRLRRMPGPQGSALRSNWALDRGEEQQSAPPASPAARPTTYTVGGGTHPGGTYRKVLATKDKPGMVKAALIFLKAHVRGHTRRLRSGKVVTVAPFERRGDAAAPAAAPADSPGGQVLEQSGVVRVIYRGTNDSGERISGGIAEGTLFAAADEATAKNYAGTGGKIERIGVKQDAKVLVEGTKEFAQVTGRRRGKLIDTMRKGENLKTAADDAAAKARAAGYDALEFTSLKDLGIAIFNEDKFVRDYSPSQQINQSPAFDGPKVGNTPIGDATEIEVGGAQRPTRNSGGQPIHPTEEGIRNFWRWFGDSKVVDAGGKPLVVYHGSYADIDEFDPSMSGSSGFSSADCAIEFTDDPYVASHYAGASDQYARVSDEAGAVYPVYLKIERPFVITRNMHNGNFSVGHQYANAIKRLREGDDSPDMMREYGVDEKYVDAEKLADAWEKGVIDGIVIEGAKWDAFDSDENTQYIVFDPKQIKSASGNSGAFDQDSPKITKSAPMVVFVKSYVRAHVRRTKDGKVISVGSYHNSVVPEPAPLRGRGKDTLTGDLFGAQPPKVVDGKKQTVTEPTDELIDEHRRLVRVLESPSHADDKAEAARQREELREYEGRAEHGDPDGAEEPKFIGDADAGQTINGGKAKVIGNFKTKAAAEAAASKSDTYRVTGYEAGKFPRGWVVTEATSGARPVFQGWKRENSNTRSISTRSGRFMAYVANSGYITLTDRKTGRTWRGEAADKKNPLETVSKVAAMMEPMTS